jgi:guanosine-3',5'-bis(diphosphate) 3'-pyrophosphohydrolase
MQPLGTGPLIQKAHDFALAAHAKQKRANGAPYFEHAYETARTVKAWGMDETTVAAAYLHDVVEDTSVSAEKIKKEFGDDVAFLVAGVTKLGEIKYRGAEAQIENMRKMVLAMAEDIRVVIIKLADRLHNMHTLSALPPQKQRRIALETSEIYAPLAYRLGMQGLSGELRDLAFPYLHPKEHNWLLKNVRELYEDRVGYLEKVKPVVEAALRESGIENFKIDFRAKRYSSLYKKMLRYNMDVENIYDLVAFRIILESVNDCYAALGIIHSLWPPMPGRIKDYIAMPKPNGYRSIHTTVFCLDNRITEFQIRTRQMHEEAELGIAAHWMYKERGARTMSKDAKELTWVKQLRQWQHDFGNDSDKFLESLKIDFFKDRIFIATPKGEVMDLPAGATPIDFAYKIHSEIGNACVGAKVNGKIVALDFELRSGDVVEILTQRGKKPSESWLRIAKTSGAKSHIKSALKDQKLGSLRGARQRKIVEIKIAALDRIGLLKDVSAVFAKSKINILSVTSPDSRAAMPIMRIKCEIERADDLERLLIRIKKLVGVRSVEHRYT